jgi:hypothetical protein
MLGIVGIILLILLKLKRDLIGFRLRCEGVAMKVDVD